MRMPTPRYQVIVGKSQRFTVGLTRHDVEKWQAKSGSGVRFLNEVTEHAYMSREDILWYANDLHGLGIESEDLEPDGHGFLIDCMDAYEWVELMTDVETSRRVR